MNERGSDVILDIADLIGDGTNYSNLCLLICIILLLALLAGFLFNYFVIQELKKTNKNLQDMNEILGYNLMKIHQGQNGKMRETEQTVSKEDESSRE